MDDQDNVLLQSASSSGPKASRNAVISFILANAAIAGLFVAQLYAPLILLYMAFPGAIVYGHLGKRDIRRDGKKHSGFAMAQYGLMVGYFCLMITVIVIVAMLNGYRAAGV